MGQRQPQKIRRALVLIPYGKQQISSEDIEEVLKTLKSDFITQGPKVPQFEEAVSEYCHSKYSVATNSATSSLHVACKALGLGSEDILWTSAVTFVASANCGLYCGAEVDFVDIDPSTFNLCPQALEDKLIKAEKINKLPKIVIPVHLAGQSSDMKEINNLSKKYGFKIIEDASHAIGGQYLNKPIGNCDFSDICIFSFHPVKIITTAEGGIATTNNPELARKMSLFRSHGIKRDFDDTGLVQDGPWHYDQVELGFNYRMSDIHAALGVSQLKRLDSFISKRNVIASKYNSPLDNMGVGRPVVKDTCISSFHLYIAQIQGKDPRPLRDEIFKRFREKEILVNLHYMPLYRHSFFKKMDYDVDDYPNSEDYYSRSISIPIYFELNDQDQNEVLGIFEEYFK